ncbi:hypothetical protein BC829DRAFT_150655 [Chytridium lagenaria]|nr:hypothetical protein BC829DRAFT_150655 [Chytridium lagenaria]
MESLNRPRRISTATTASAYSTCSSSPSIHLDDEEGNTGGGETTDGEVLHPHTEETVQRIPGLLVPRRPKSASTLSGRMSPTSTIKGGTRSSDNETTLRRSASGVSSSDSPSRRQPERQMRKIFKGLIPDDEVFFEDHMCAYQREKGMLVQGKMYLTEGFLLFHANILGFVTRVVVGWGEVEEVRKGKTAFVFPNAVIVRLKDRVVSFAVFVWSFMLCFYFFLYTLSNTHVSS